jgi:hypothetical protein
LDADASPGNSCLEESARAALDRRPQIVLTLSGFSWREWSEVEIPWSEIVEIGLKQNGFVRYISLTLRDPARYRADSLITRFFWYFRIRRLGHIAVLLLGLNRKPEDILEAVKRFRDGAVRRA